MDAARLLNDLQMVIDQIGEMERGEVRWLGTDGNGRLTVDDTARMLRVAKASRARLKRVALLASEE